MSSIPILPTYSSVVFRQNETTKTQYVSKPFKCMTCLRSFRRMEHLNRHILTHTGERPFKCEVEGCGRCFSRQDTLLRHLKVHDKSRDKKKKQKQTKKTQKKKTKNSVKRKSVQEDNIEENNKKQKFDSINISSSSKESNLNLSTEVLSKNGSINSKIENNEKDYSKSTFGSNTEIFSEPKDTLNAEGNNNNNNINTNYDSNFNSLNSDSNSSSSCVKNKPISVSNIDEAMKLFNLSSSPSQSSNSIFNTYEEQSILSNRYNNKLNYETTSNMDNTINTSKQSRRDFSYDTSNHNSMIPSENRPIFERIQDSNEYTQDLEGLGEFNLEDFNLQPQNKLSTSSAKDLNNYTILNDSLMMDMNIQHASSSKNSVTINSPNNNYNKSFASKTNPLLLSSSLNPSSSSLLVDSAISKQYNSNLNSNSNSNSNINTNTDINTNSNSNTNTNTNTNLDSSLSLTIPLEVSPRKRRINNFYSSMTMPQDDSKGIIHEKKSYTEKSSITIPTNFKTDENNMLGSLNLPLGNYRANYSSVLSNNSNPSSLLAVQGVGMEEKGKLNNLYLMEDERKSNNIYRSTPITLELPSSSSPNYNSYVATDVEIESKIKITENVTNSIVQQQQQKSPNENETSNIINTTNTETTSNIPLKPLVTSSKNEEITDLQSSVSSNYLTPPLSPSLPTSTFIECQEKTYQRTKIYPCGLDTPCVDNCNCNECIATMTLPSLINRYTETIKEEDRNDFASTSLASPSVSLMDASFNTMNIPTNSANDSKIGVDVMTSSSSPLNETNEDTCHCEHCRNSNDGYSQSQNIEQGNLDRINDHNQHDYNNDSDHDHDHDHDHDIHCQCHREENQELVEGVSRSLANEEEIQVNNNNSMDEQVNYKEGDVIIEVGCSNVNCPNMNCPKKFFRPIASVSGGKICSTSEAMDMLNEAPCSNYNPLYHLIAAAELATKRINKRCTNSEENQDGDENNECSHCQSCQCTHDVNDIVDKEENTQSHSTSSYKNYSPDIENCHLALSTTSPSEIEALDASDRHSNFKNYRSIKAKIGSHHHTKSHLNNNENTISVTETSQYHNINMMKDNIILTTTTSTTSSLSKQKNSEEKNHLYGRIYIRQDYNDSPSVTSAASYAGINYTKLLANQMKLKAESNKKNIQNYEIFKNELVSTPSSILSTSSAALNPIASDIQKRISTTSSSSYSSTLNSNTNIFKNNKLSWVPAPIQSQLEPNINPFILKSNLYGNVNFSSLRKDKSLTEKLIENSDRAVDSCQVNILDKEEAIKQAIRCSNCPHSDRCYKRIRIEQLLN
ncbi:hypothetical protein LY90DRAFT_215370 [Neocallimastix californiae]|uniref:C2H2-type domain-containing protein n=1 Tax=Neocallimastix californiae TaxID=1754190 RepID=A0A1Y1Z1D5_9FUNG|nr:hypothetical protein LY90DRAFT_215370 [Neocallimastix californiae]|eukprot:ORY03996.1 hypothetical protein LY90DRAFT_215370 [Neocallimastix californiae]